MNKKIYFILIILSIFSCNMLNETFTITYDDGRATSGEVPVDSEEYIDGDKATILANEGNLNRKGYTFLGWKDGDSYVEPGCQILMTRDLELVPVWHEVGVNVSFDANGGHFIDELETETYFPEGSNKITIDINEDNFPFKPGFLFAGWCSYPDYYEEIIYRFNEGNEDDYGDIYLSNENVVEGELIFYAVWIPFQNFNMLEIQDGSYTYTSYNNDEVSISIDAFSLGQYEITTDFYEYVKYESNKLGYIYSDGISQNDYFIRSIIKNEFEDDYSHEEDLTSVEVAIANTFVFCNALSELSGRSPVYRDVNNNVVRDYGVFSGNYSDDIYYINPPNSIVGVSFSEIVPFTSNPSNGFRLPLDYEWLYAASESGIEMNISTLENPNQLGFYDLLGGSFEAMISSKNYLKVDSFNFNDETEVGMKYSSYPQGYYRGFRIAN